MKKIIAVSFIIMIVAALTLAVLRKIPWLYFYGVAIVASIVAYFVLPKMK